VVLQLNLKFEFEFSVALDLELTTQQTEATYQVENRGQFSLGNKHDQDVKGQPNNGGAGIFPTTAGSCAL
jgi:hypothetical protein